MKQLENDEARIADLHALLSQLAANMESAETAYEPVSARVLRRKRFSHQATTAHGLTLEIDEPVAFGGTGQSPDPAELLLAAVGASLSVTLTAHAALRNKTIDHIGVTLNGRIHGPSFFAPHKARQQGVLDVEIVVAVSSPMPRTELSALFAEAVLASPVLRSLKRRPRVRLELTRSA
jgi:pyruvate dehydrogenase E2 component (dihydrolipoamide acetyltransferase)